MHHTLDEKAPGANLSKEEALARAEAYLRDQKKVDLSGWNLVETHTDKKPARTDHMFEWEQKAALDPGIGPAGRAHPHATARARRRSFRLPHFHQDSRGVARCGKPHHRGATRADLRPGASGIAVVLITVLVIFLRSLKHPEIARVPWRRLAQVVGLGACSPAIVIFANRMPQLLLNYTTTWPLKMFYAILFISLIFVTALYLAGAVLLLGIAWFFLERAFGPGRIPAWTGMRAAYYRDAFCVASFGSAAVMGLDRLPGLFSRWPLLRHTLGAAVPGWPGYAEPRVGHDCLVRLRPVFLPLG